jgi:hypothetical protein
MSWPELGLLSPSCCPHREGTQLCRNSRWLGSAELGSRSNVFFGSKADVAATYLDRPLGANSRLCCAETAKSPRHGRGLLLSGLIQAV